MKRYSSLIITVLFLLVILPENPGAQTFTIDDLEKIESAENTRKNFFLPKWSESGDKISFEAVDKNTQNIFVYSIADNSVNKVTAFKSDRRSQKNVTSFDYSFIWDKNSKQKYYFISRKFGVKPEIFSGSVNSANFTNYTGRLPRDEKKQAIDNIILVNKSANTLVFMMGGDSESELYYYKKPQMARQRDRLIQITAVAGMLKIRPQFSPVNNDLIFIGDLTGKSEIYRIPDYSTGKTNLNIGQFQKLTNSAELSEDFPLYSPDGSKIAFITVEQSGENTVKKLYVMNDDGSNLKLLNDNILVYNRNFAFSWHPDGEHVFYILNKSEEGFPICYINVNTGMGSKLNTGTDNNTTLAISADGNMIALSSGGMKVDENLTWSSIYHARLQKR